MIRPATDTDFETVLEIINDGATAYRGVIPEDRWKDPYMPADELRHEMAAGVSFLIADGKGGGAAGVMGIQPVKDVILIRHAYVRTARQRTGLGSQLLENLIANAPRPVLIGTWKAARWAVRFYEKHGFSLIEGDEKDRLLKTYWDIPSRQVETSVVMADRRAMKEIVRGKARSDEPDPNDPLGLLRP